MKLIPVLFDSQQPSGSDLLQTVRIWLDAIEVRNSTVAQLLCRLIPPACPFERELKLFGRSLFQLPPLCKLNPLYEQLLGLRFRALCFLANETAKEESRNG